MSVRFASKAPLHRRTGRNAALAAVDIGSSRVSCAIAAPEDVTEDSLVQVRGVACQPSRGVRGGVVTGLDALDRTVRLAVQEAENAAGVDVQDVVIGIGGPDLRSTRLVAELPAHGREITAHHAREVVNAAILEFAEPNREIIHATVIGFGVDGGYGVHDPRGMCAVRLRVALLAATAPTSAIRNVVHAVGRAHLKPVALAAAPYAAGLACLIPDELERGAVVIDFGAECTGIAAFRGSAPILIGSVPLGGAHATADLAQGVGTTFAAAERLKTSHGSAALPHDHAFEMVDTPRLGTNGRLELSRLPRAELTAMLRPRMEEILERVEATLSGSGVRGLPRRLVLTGGASMMPGLRELARDVLGSPARLAGPIRGRGMGEAYQTPAFSALTGLLCHRFGVVGADCVVGEDSEQRGSLRRAFDWLRDNF